MCVCASVHSQNLCWKALQSDESDNRNKGSIKTTTTTTTPRGNEDVLQDFRPVAANGQVDLLVRRVFGSLDYCDVIVVRFNVL